MPADTPNASDPATEAATPVLIAAFIWVVLILACLTARSALHEADYLIVGVPPFALARHLVVVRRRLKIGPARPGSAVSGSGNKVAVKGD